MKKKIAIVVQRYGDEINGGAEYHAKLIAERLVKFFDMEVFTTTALDYITWEPHFPEGRALVNGIPINRFHVRELRDPKRFGEIQEYVFFEEHSLKDETDWLNLEGPLVPDLISELKIRDQEFDFFIFFSYRYYHSFQGISAFRGKSILVPTAEHDKVIYLRLFKHFFNLPGAIVYNSVEEKEMINRISGNESVIGDVVGVGSEIPDLFEPAAFRKKFDIQGRYFVYIGRLDENKGVPEMLDYFVRLVEEIGIDYTLVLMGKSLIEIPRHSQIKFLGFVNDRDKFNGLKDSDFLIIPSQFESLSMVALEAWAIGKPVVANGRTEVLRGQCERSNAGLWYTGYEEFSEIIRLLDENPYLKDRLGKNGKKFFQTHYAWEVIENKYKNIINRLNSQMANQGFD
jgi:glycosyltransferase involved in cell wall biosynthesis